MTDTQQAQSRLANLSLALDALDAQLDPLFSQSLVEASAVLEPLQQAKLHTLLPYLIYDLVFIYLKTQGVDPKTHPVISELERVKHYFDKIATAEKSETKRATMDTEAAARFIKHALAQAETVLKTPVQDLGPSTSSVNESIPVKITEKMVLRAQYEQELKDTAEDEDEELQIFEENLTTSSGKLKEKEPETPGSKKRRKVALDSFAGYSEGTSIAKDDPTAKAAKKTKKKSSKKS